MPKFSSGYSSKTTPVNADKVLIADSAASDAIKSVTIVNLITNRAVAILQAIAGWVTTAMIGDGQVTGSKLSTAAVLLGYSSSTAIFTTSSVAGVLITGLTKTVTVPAGGRSVKITGYSRAISNNTSGAYAQLGIWVDGVRIGGTSARSAGASYDAPGICVAIHTPAAGSHTYELRLNAAGGGIATASATSDEAAYLIVELV